MKKTVFTILLLLTAVLTKAQTHWQPADPPGSSGLTATLTSVIVINGEEQRSDQLEVGVFHGDECRGANIASYVAPVDKYLVFLSIFGIENEEDTFRLYDHATETELDVTCNVVYVYHNDNNLGTIFDPYVIDFNLDVSMFEITAEANPEEGGTIIGADTTYANNTMCQLEALANQGYHFERWTKDGLTVSTSEIYSFVVTESAHFVADFALDTYEIMVKADPEEGGDVTGGGVYPLGQSVVLTAAANADYRFLYWKEDGVIISEDDRLELVVDHSRELVAHFMSTVGVEELEGPHFAFYPNPVSNVLIVESELPVFQCDMYNFAGALVVSFSECPGRFEIPVGDLPRGVYLLKLTTASSVQMKKFLKH